MRISENDTWFSAPGFMVRAMVWMKGVQLLTPSAVPDDVDLRAQHHDVGDLEPPQQQRQQAQIGGQHVDAQRGVGGAAALQPDVVEGDIAAGEYRDVDRALDHEIEAGDGADLRFDRLRAGRRG